MPVFGSDLRWIAVLDTSLRINANRNLGFADAGVPASNAQTLVIQKRAEPVSGATLENWLQLPTEFGDSRKAARRKIKSPFCPPTR
jgi:hypothetical protein